MDASIEGVMRGKRGLVMGVANNRSLAWGMASTVRAAGAELALTYQGDALKKRVEPLAAELNAHVAGHYVEAEDLRVDTHAAPVCDPVWQLLDEAYNHFGVFPTLLERDFNIPPLDELLREVEMIGDLQAKHAQPAREAAHG